MSIDINRTNEFKLSEKKLLCIAVPTYNRAARLDRALADLLRLISQSGQQSDLSVFVSNNGSTDETAAVIKEYDAMFRRHKIAFSSEALDVNGGFDVNALNCYQKTDADYVWFVSDDDNLEENSLTAILEDIRTFSPSVLYYNFNQEPHGKHSPLIKEIKFYDCFNEQNIAAVSKILDCPKLTSVVIKKFNGEAGIKVAKACGYGFIHAALAMQTAIDHGNIFHSDKFIASPDVDFMDHVDFPPYIGNNMKKVALIVLDLNKRIDLQNCFVFGHTNPLTSSMNTLATYYRGNIALSPSLKRELYATVLRECKNLRYFDINYFELVVHIVRLLFGYLYNLTCLVLTGRQAKKIRS